MTVRDNSVQQQITRIQWSKVGITVYSDAGFVCRLEDQRDRTFLNTVVVRALQSISNEQLKRRFTHTDKEADNAIAQGNEQEGQATEHSGDDQRGPSTEAGSSGGVQSTETDSSEATDQITGVGV